MGGQPSREIGSIGTGPLDAEGEGPQPAQGQPRLHRAGDRPAEGALPGQSGVQVPSRRRVGRDGQPEDDVRVAREVLRRRVHDDVDAVLEGSLQQRGGEGVVDDDERPRLVRRGRQTGDVGDLEQRVGRRLEPQQVGARQGGPDGGIVRDVDPAHGEPASLGGLGEGDDDAVVGRGRRDDGPALGHEGERRVHGRHAGGVEEGPAPFEVTHGQLEGGPRRVVDAGVVDRSVLDVGGGEGDRSVERRARRPLGPTERHHAGAGGEGCVRVVVSVLHGREARR